MNHRIHNIVWCLLAVLLFTTAFTIAVFYALFAFEYILTQTLITDEIVNAILVLANAAGLLFYYVKFTRLPINKQKTTTTFFQNSLRYFLSFIFFDYAFIKICGNMFSTSLATLDTPLYQLRGFQLTWRFFGYSPVYNWCIILMQLLCGTMLLFRRTTLAACLIGFGMMLNITLINFTHGIQLKLFSVIYTAMLLYFVLLHYRTLVASILHATQSSSAKPAYLTQRFSRSNFYALFFLSVILIICGCKEWKMKTHYAGTTSVYGIWALQNSNDSSFINNSKLIFDKGDEGTIKTANGDANYFMYSVDEAMRTIRFWGEPFKKDTLKYSYKIVTDSELLFSNHDTLFATLKKQY